MLRLLTENQMGAANLKNVYEMRGESIILYTDRVTLVKSVKGRVGCTNIGTTASVTVLIEH